MKAKKVKAKKTVSAKDNAQIIMKQLKKLIKDKKNPPLQVSNPTTYYPRMIDDFQRAIENILLCMRAYAAVEDLKKVYQSHPELPESVKKDITDSIKDGEQMLEQGCGIRPHIS